MGFKCRPVATGDYQYVYFHCRFVSPTDQNSSYIQRSATQAEPARVARHESMKLIAFTRNISPAIERCELSHIDRTPIDLELAQPSTKPSNTPSRRGCEVRHLPDASGA